MDGDVLFNLEVPPYCISDLILRNGNNLKQKNPSFIAYEKIESIIAVGNHQ